MNSQLKLHKFGAFLFAFIVFVISAPSIGRAETAQLPPKFIHHFPNGDRFTIFFEPEVVVLQKNSKDGEARTYEILSNRRILAALVNNPDFAEHPLYQSSYRTLTGVGKNRSEISIWSNRFFKTDISFILTEQYLYLFNDKGEHTITPLETFCRSCLPGEIKITPILGNQGTLVISVSSTQEPNGEALVLAVNGALELAQVGKFSENEIPSIELMGTTLAIVSFKGSSKEFAISLEFAQRQQIEFDTLQGTTKVASNSTLQIQDSGPASTYLNKLVQPAPSGPTTGAQLPIKREVKGKFIDPSLMAKLAGDKGEPGISVKALVEETFPNYAKERADAIRKVQAKRQDSELARLREGFRSRRSKVSVLLGESGAGKTHIVDGFVKLVSEGKIPEIPADTVFLHVEELGTTGGTKYRGELELRLKYLLQYARNHDVILIIDGMDRMRGNGTSAGDHQDLITKISPFFADGSLKIIAMAEKESFFRAYGGDTRIINAINIINVDSPTEEKVIDRLMEWIRAENLDPLPRKVVERLAFLSREFSTIGTPWVRALNLLDRLYARMQTQEIPAAQITLQFVDNFAGEVYNIDSRRFTPEGREDLYSHFTKTLDSRVQGLQQAKNLLHHIAKVHIRGLSLQASVPQIILQAGPAGVGKTFVPNIFAEAMGFNFKRIILSHLTGKTGEDLLQAIGKELEKDIFTVFLFDEVEKAPEHIQALLLGIADSNHIMVSKAVNGVDPSQSTQVRLDTSKSTFFFSTNAGEGAILKDPRISGERLKKALEGPGGLNHFLVDRAEHLLTYTPPQTRSEFMDVTRLALRHELKSKSAGATSNWTAENEEDYLNRLADKYFDPTQGYRAVIAQIKKAVTSSILELKDGSSTQTSCLLHLKLVTLDALDVPPNNSKKAQRRGIGFVHYDN